MAKLPVEYGQPGAVVGVAGQLYQGYLENASKRVVVVVAAGQTDDPVD